MGPNWFLGPYLKLTGRGPICQDSLTLILVSPGISYIFVFILSKNNVQFSSQVISSFVKWGPNYFLGPYLELRGLGPIQLGPLTLILVPPDIFYTFDAQNMQKYCIFFISQFFTMQGPFQVCQVPGTKIGLISSNHLYSF